MWGEVSVFADSLKEGWGGAQEEDGGAALQSHD